MMKPGGWQKLETTKQNINATDDTDSIIEICTETNGDKYMTEPSRIVNNMDKQMKERKLKCGLCPDRQWLIG